jgi:hypothetical protein
MKIWGDRELKKMSPTAQARVNFQRVRHWFKDTFSVELPDKFMTEAEADRVINQIPDEHRRQNATRYEFMRRCLMGKIE